MKLTSLKVNAAALEAGIWIDDLPGTDIELKVRSQSSAAAEMLLGKLSRAVPLADRDADGRINPDVRRGIADRVLAEAVLVDWRNLTDDDGNRIPFSSERALAIITDPDMRPFRDLVEHAMSVAEARSRSIEAVVEGNFEAPPSGA